MLGEGGVEGDGMASLARSSLMRLNEVSRCESGSLWGFRLLVSIICKSDKLEGEPRSVLEEVAFGEFLMLVIELISGSTSKTSKAVLELTTVCFFDF